MTGQNIILFFFFFEHRDWVRNDSKESHNLSLSGLLSWICPANMVNTVKLFVNVQKTFHALGIVPSQSINLKWLSSLNYKNVFVFSEVAFGCIASAGFFLFKMDSLKEGAPTLFVSICGFMILLYFATYIWKIEHFLKLISDYEEIIEKRKWNSYVVTAGHWKKFRWKY